MNRRGLFFYVLVVIVIVLSALVFENHKQMSPVFTAPFFSGAANFDYEKGWRFSEQEYWSFESLSNGEKENFRFKPMPEASLMPYRHYNSGYLYIIMVAKKLFFWLADIKAIKYFQVLSHILLSLMLCSRINNRLGQLAFVALYAVNPLVIYFVTFPFLYFWQVLPSAIFALLLLSGFQIKPYQAGLFGLFTAVAFCTRPTVVLVVALIGVFLFLKVNVRAGLIYLVTFAGVTLILFEKAENKSLWHTVYIGVGAYPNPYMQGLTDNNGYALYRRHIGESLSVSIGGNFYTKEVFERYNHLLLDKYMQIVRQDLLLIIKNAFINFLQSFSVGYFVNAPVWVNYLSAGVGAIFLALLCIRKQFLWIMAIALNSLAFTPYFPPIQAYMFGGYILLVCAFVAQFQSFFQNFNFPKSFAKPILFPNRQ
jgi:hypothetical protein